MPASERDGQQDPAARSPRSEQTRERVHAKVEQALEHAQAQVEQALERAEQARDVAERAREVAEKKVIVEDPRGIRALAHPARIEAIDQLYSGEILTATELANAVDVSPSAMSYHLRELAKWGLIERVDDAVDGRERRWRAAGTDLQIGSRSATSKSTASRAAHLALTRQIFDRALRAIEQHMSRGAEEPEEWRATLEMGTYDLILTKQEMRELGDRITELLKPYGTHRENAPEGARKVRVMTVMVPVR